MMADTLDSRMVVNLQMIKMISQFCFFISVMLLTFVTLIKVNTDEILSSLKNDNIKKTYSKIENLRIWNEKKKS